MIDYVAFGIIIDDIVFPDGRTQMGVIGGGGVQTAWGMAAALGSGEEVGLVAGIGQDLDENLLQPLYAAGINLDGLRRSQLPTPRAWQLMEHDGRRTQVWRSPTDSLPAQLAIKWDMLPDAYRDAQNFHWGIHPDERITGMALDLRRRGRQVSIETFRAPHRALSGTESHAIFHACTIFSAATHELAALTGSKRGYESALRQFKAGGGRCLVERQGANGAIVYDLHEMQSFHVPAVKTQVIEETGAGNAFCGAFLARLGDGVKEAASHAVVAASYMIEQVGIPPTLPTPTDYARRLAEVRPQIVTKALTL